MFSFPGAHTSSVLKQNSQSTGVTSTFEITLGLLEQKLNINLEGFILS